MKKLVALIPVERLNDIVEKNIIANTVPISSNAYMKFLFVLWYNYIDPNGTGTMDCPYCLQNVYNNFKSMQGEIIEAYRQNKILESL